MQPQNPGPGQTPGQQPQPGYPVQPGNQPVPYGAVPPLNTPGPQPLPTYPAPNNADPSAYEFIVNPSHTSAKKIPLSGIPKPLILVIIILVVLTLGFAAFAAIRGSGNKNVAEYFSIVQQQAEIQRLSQIAWTQQTVSSDTKADALTTRMTVSTDSAQLTAFLAEGGVKFDEKKIALGQDVLANKTLDAAITTGTFDSAFNKILIEKLTKYQQSLQTTYQNISSQTGKQILSASYDHTTLLIKQAKQDSPAAD
ncbi:MAG: hypothetical protein JWM37_182 [Candidatus Saccharibacteria bacterium]|nr:hypothetical protein [Candidatus Saccharibacteria bacterium]